MSAHPRRRWPDLRLRPDGPAATAFSRRSTRVHRRRGVPARARDHFPTLLAVRRARVGDCRGGRLRHANDRRLRRDLLSRSRGRRASVLQRLHTPWFDGLPGADRATRACSRVRTTAGCSTRRPASSVTRARRAAIPRASTPTASTICQRVPRLESYRDFYFVNYNAQAVPLVDYLAGAAEFLDLVADQSEHGLEVIAGGQEVHSSGNWKLLIENSYDAYHGPTLHRSYFEFLDTRVAGQNMVATQKGMGFGLGNGHGALRDRAQVRATRGAVDSAVRRSGADRRSRPSSASSIERLGAERAERVAEHQRNLIVFPNLVHQRQHRALGAHRVFPTAPDQADRVHLGAGHAQRGSAAAQGPTGQLPDLRRSRRLRDAGRLRGVCAVPARQRSHAPAAGATSRRA